MRLQVLLKEDGVELAGDHPRHGLDEEGHGGVFDVCSVTVSVRIRLKQCHENETLTAEQDLNQRQRHQAPLRIMHIISIPQPRLGLSADLPFLPLRIPPRDEPPAEVVAQILDDHARLREDQRPRGGWRLDGDDGGFAERVDLLELRRSEVVLPELVDLEVVGQVQLLEQPEDALRAGFLQPAFALLVSLLEVIRKRCRRTDQ